MSSTPVRWLFGDQLGPHFLDDHGGPVLMVESKAVFRRRRFHGPRRTWSCRRCDTARLSWATW